jgi:hypothetical protein
MDTPSSRIEVNFEALGDARYGEDGESLTGLKFEQERGNVARGGVGREIKKELEPRRMRSSRKRSADVNVNLAIAMVYLRPVCNCRTLGNRRLTGRCQQKRRGKRCHQQIPFHHLVPPFAT